MGILAITLAVSFGIDSWAALTGRPAPFLGRYL